MLTRNVVQFFINAEASDAKVRQTEHAVNEYWDKSIKSGSLVLEKG